MSERLEMYFIKRGVRLEKLTREVLSKNNRYSHIFAFDLYFEINSYFYELTNSIAVEDRSEGILRLYGELPKHTVQLTEIVKTSLEKSLLIYAENIQALNTLCKKDISDCVFHVLLLSVNAYKTTLKLCVSLYQQVEARVEQDQSYEVWKSLHEEFIESVLNSYEPQIEDLKPSDSYEIEEHIGQLLKMKRKYSDNELIVDETKSLIRELLPKLDKPHANTFRESCLSKKIIHELYEESRSFPTILDNLCMLQELQSIDSYEYGMLEECIKYIFIYTRNTARHPGGFVYPKLNARVRRKLMRFLREEYQKNSVTLYFMIQNQSSRSLRTLKNDLKACKINLGCVIEIVQEERAYHQNYNKPIESVERSNQLFLISYLNSCLDESRKPIGNLPKGVVDYIEAQSLSGIKTIYSEIKYKGSSIINPNFKKRIEKQKKHLEIQRDINDLINMVKKVDEKTIIKHLYYHDFELDIWVNSLDYLKQLKNLMLKTSYEEKQNEAKVVIYLLSEVIVLREEFPPILSNITREHIECRYDCSKYQDERIHLQRYIYALKKVKEDLWVVFLRYQDYRSLNLLLDDLPKSYYELRRDIKSHMAYEIFKKAERYAFEDITEEYRECICKYLREIPVASESDFAEHSDRMKEYVRSQPIKSKLLIIDMMGVLKNIAMSDSVYSILSQETRYINLDPTDSEKALDFIIYDLGSRKHKFLEEYLSMQNYLSLISFERDFKAYHSRYKLNDDLKAFQIINDLLPDFENSPFRSKKTKSREKSFKQHNSDGSANETLTDKRIHVESEKPLSSLASNDTYHNETPDPRNEKLFDRKKKEGKS